MARHLDTSKGGGQRPVIDAPVVTLAVLGAGIMLYPTLADLYNKVISAQTISGYDHSVEERTQEERRSVWSEATAFNRALAERTLAAGGTIDASNLADDLEVEYQEALRVSDDGVMGYLEIPKIGVSLPIGHGTDSGVLEVGAGHLEGSSLPVGGEGTHCVLVGHTGLPSARLFTDVSSLEAGDGFELIVLGRTLAYQVVEVRAVEPTDVDSLRLVEGEDLCTLLTCTPYGINSHRLLVTGQRVDTAQETEGGGFGLYGEWPWLLLALALVCAAIGLVRLIGGRGRPKRE